MTDLYFDLIGGISGDMTVAGLLSLGVDLKFLKKELLKIKIKNYFLKTSHIQRGHIKALKFDCCARSKKNYTYNQIIGLVNDSKLDRKIKEDIKKVYCVLKDAEVAVHGHKHENIHFHQIGEIDSIIDIASVCICLNKLEVKNIFFGAIPVGNKMSPAAFKLFENKEVYFNAAMFENVTPTGMAILAALGRQVDAAMKDSFKIGRCGYGGGQVDMPGLTNVLRVAELSAKELDYDELCVIESNIDDMNPQFFEYIFDKLFEAGALDVFVSSLYMKKTRPGFLLTVLSKPEKLGMISRLVLAQTSTTGVRYYFVRRLKLERQLRCLRYKGFKVRVKYIQLPDGAHRLAPEYDDCKALAKKIKLPIARIYDEIKEKAQAL